MRWYVTQIVLNDRTPLTLFQSYSDPDPNGPFQWAEYDYDYDYDSDDPNAFSHYSPESYYDDEDIYEYGDDDYLVDY